MINNRATRLFDAAWSDADSLKVHCHRISGARVLDAGVAHRGSLAGGLVLAKLCLADYACVSLQPLASPWQGHAIASDWEVMVRTDLPLIACLGSQYAGWPIQVGDYFAMASGPLRMIRGREEMLQHLRLGEASDTAVGVLESETLPTEQVIDELAAQCGVASENVSIGIAPCTSIAGCVQVVARSVETALHKLHAIGFDVHSIVSAMGVAPLPPIAKAGSVIKGIGRTNDAILYGGRVTLWVECEDDAIASIIERVPSSSSSDYGRPFEDVFKDYGYDFYKVDPLLFSPAMITIHNLTSGYTFTAGRLEPTILRQSFLA
jgi:methenyltetrahydromethanopterin cyclohydrolase